MGSYKKEDCGDTLEFRESPPKVWPDGSAKDANFAAIAPKQNSPAKGHDTYQGIAGDGIVGGNAGSNHESPATWGFTSKGYSGPDGLSGVPSG